ncbi:hypothetical protein D7V86_09185 [bacterium D16-51]|nr:hypothetical protein D7V96_09825 [bacterium D16-59]RKI60368.1 hypothetical protein D7V86_09185 [bacterium D16-51]
MRKLKKFAAGFAAAAIALTMVTTMAPSVANAAVSKEGEKAAKAEFDPNGTYHAYFGLEQTGSWIFRNPWYSEELGKTGTDLTEDTPYESILRSQEGVKKMDGTVTDAEITGNGVYSVGVEGLNNILKDAETQDSSSVISMLFVSTDVPASAKDTFKISDWKLILDGNEQTLPAEVFYNPEAEQTCAVIRFDAVNTYMKDKGEYADCPSILTPGDSIKIVFTVSGMAKDNPDAVEETPAPAEDDAAAGDNASSAGSDSDSDSSSDSGSSMVPIVVGVVVVVVVAGVAIVMTKKKK